MEALLNNYLLKDLTNIIMEYMRDFYIIRNNMNQREYTLLATISEINNLMDVLSKPLKSKKYKKIDSDSGWHELRYTYYRIIPSQLETIQSITKSDEKYKQIMLKSNENSKKRDLKHDGEEKGKKLRKLRATQKRNVSKKEYTHLPAKLFLK